LGFQVLEDIVKKSKRETLKTNTSSRPGEMGYEYPNMDSIDSQTFLRNDRMETDSNEPALKTNPFIFFSVSKFQALPIN
jgi:hypothetical protein